MKKIIISMSIVLTLLGCKKDNPIITQQSAITFKTNHTYNGTQLKLNDIYTTPSNDTFQLTKLAYYISNIELIGENVPDYKIAESYWLVDLKEDLSHSRTFTNIPSGKYKGLRFLVGVDSARNTTGAQEGDLDPAKGMFWSWTTGYIMFKLEGNLLSQPGGEILLHLGGFEGNNNVVHQVTLEKALDITSEAFSLPLNMELHNLFNNADNPILLSEINVINMPGAKAVKVSQNIASMFSL